MAVGKVGGGNRKGGAGAAKGTGAVGKSGGTSFDAKVTRSESVVGASGVVGSSNVVATDPVTAQALDIARQLKSGQIKSREEATRKLVAQVLKEKVRMQSKALTQKIADALEEDPRLSQALDRLWTANFLTFAHYRIKGAIFDGLRKMGVLRGADQRNAHVGERATAYLGNLSDRESGGSNHRGSCDDDVRDISNAVTGLAMVFATSLDAGDGLQLSDEQMPADQRLELEQLKIRIRAALEKLPEKERKLLAGYYFQSKTLEEAGAEIGQSKSWASRLHARAIERLKQLLSEDAPESSPDTGRKAHGGTTGSSADRPAEAAGPPGRRGAQAGSK
jgi:RNA polymerase sigma factor for flagellar operon FliA